MLLTAIKNKYRSLLEFFQTVASKIRGLVLLAYRLRRLFQLTKPVPEIRHLAFSVRESIRQVAVNKEINEKIREGYFAERLVIVAALPKSASSVIGSCIAAIQSNSGGAGIRHYARYMLANQDSNLRPELVQDFPKGGVLKYHPRATGKNLKVLDLLCVKYVILLRHPADQLVAAYCHELGSPLLEEAVKKDVWVYDHIYPKNWRFFQEGIDLDETIQYLIDGGYLNAVLSWITDWLLFRDINRSLVLRYEDFVMNRDETLKNISNFLYSEKLDERALIKCNKIAGGYVSERTGANNTRKYPHGWTGKIGIWKSYFSDENKRDYLSVVKKFLNYYPHASLILDVYPNLLDIDNLLDKKGLIS